MGASGEDGMALKLSSKYCELHRPRLPDGIWNSRYKQAFHARGQLKIELTNLSQLQTFCLKPIASAPTPIKSYLALYTAANAQNYTTHANIRQNARDLVDGKLSDRKKEILVRTSAGESQAEISRSLGISRQAVSKAVASIPRKFFLKADLDLQVNV